MQAALVSCAASPVTLLVISIADFSKHATPDVLRVMRDEVHLLPSLFEHDQPTGSQLPSCQSHLVHSQEQPTLQVVPSFIGLTNTASMSCTSLILS